MSDEMEKSKAIEMLNGLISKGKQLHLGTAERAARWRLDSIAVLERVFGKGRRQLKTFRDIRWTPKITYGNPDAQVTEANSARSQALTRALTVLESALHEIEQFWESDRTGYGEDPCGQVERVCNRFHVIARQLRNRYGGRKALEINDEYDLQDLLHALLLLDFEDVRREEWTGSYAGAPSRIDFVLKREKIGLEAKHTRPTLSTKEIGEQLIVDCQRYKTHRDCEMLICFVYDPEGLIGNPRGIENDLESAGGELPVKVFVRP